MIVCVVVCVDVCVRTKVDPLMQSKSFLLGPELEGVRRSVNRVTPFCSEAWVARTARRLGTGSKPEAMRATKERRYQSPWPRPELKRFGNRAQEKGTGTFSIGISVLPL
jgi:hypothetical protein